MMQLSFNLIGMALALTLAQTNADFNAVPPRVPLGRLNTQPEPWVDKVVTTCGAFRATVPDLMLSLVDNDPSGIFVDPRVVPVRKSDEMVCVTGLFRRQDGLTQKEVEIRKLPFTNYVDMYNPDYIIRPIGKDPSGN